MGNEVSAGYCEEVISQTNQPSIAYFAFGVLSIVTFLVLPFVLLIPCNCAGCWMIKKMQHWLRIFIAMFDFDTQVVTRIGFGKKEEEKREESHNMELGLSVIGGYFTLALAVFGIFVLIFVFYSHYSPVEAVVVSTSSEIMYFDNTTDPLNQQYELMIPNITVASECDAVQVIGTDNYKSEEIHFDLTRKFDEEKQKCTVLWNYPLRVYRSSISRIFSIKITGYKTPEKTTNEKMMIRMVSEYSNRTVLSGDYDRDDLMILADTCLQMSIAGVENRTYNVKILTKVRKLCSQMYGPVAKCTDRQLSYDPDYHVDTENAKSEINIVFFVSDREFDSFLKRQPPSILLISAIAVIGILLTVQPLLRKFTFNTFSVFYKRYITGIGIGKFKGFLVGFVSGIYFFVAAGLLMLLINQTIDHALRLPVYKVEDHILEDLNTAIATALRLYISSSVLYGAAIVSTIIMIIFSTFYLGTNSSVVSNLERTQDLSIVNTSHE